MFEFNPSLFMIVPDERVTAEIIGRNKIKRRSILSFFLGSSI